MTDTTVTIPARVQGPPATADDGYSAGPGSGGLDPERRAWGARDWPSGLAAMRDGAAAVLGTMTAPIARPLVTREPLVVVGRLMAIDGRMRRAGRARYDRDAAWSEAGWINPPV